tara:strand:- start:3145 stop:4083 length:939 start_codon:yes stop_codon:yes gene_type:complete
MNYWTKKVAYHGLIYSRQTIFYSFLLVIFSLVCMTGEATGKILLELQSHQQDHPVHEQEMGGTAVKIQPTVSEILNAGEWFRYEVSYGFFTLGWVEVSILPDSLYNGQVHHHLFTRMISNDRLPLIGYERDEFNTLFYVNREGLPVSSLFWKDNIDEEKMYEIVYRFDSTSGQVYYKEEDETTGILSLVKPATAGHIVFIYSRLFAGGGMKTRLPVYVGKKLGYLDFDHSSISELRTYEAFEDSVATYKTTGRTVDIVGPFGFSGRFEAFFAQDNFRIPLEARVKMFLGSAVVKLIEYRQDNSVRTNWKGLR